jgi:hypothetical protein
LEAGKTWTECHNRFDGLKAQSTILELRDTSPNHLFSRIVIDWTDNDQGKKKYGGTVTCYDGAKVGSEGWVKNTDVKNIAVEACKASLKAAAATKTWGTYKKKFSGFHDGLGGPIVRARVKYMLTTKLKDQNIDINNLGQDLCLKGVEHLVSDKVWPNYSTYIR